MTETIVTPALENPRAGEAWCALYTRSNHEKLVARSCTSYGIRHYLPLVDPLEAVRRREAHSDMPDGNRIPLFSCYLFACMGFGSREALLKTKGLVRILPVPRSDQLLGELRQIDTALQVWQGVMPGPALTRGIPVRVTRGPLAGLEGLVARRFFKHRRERLVLNVTLLGQAATLEIDARCIEPIDKGQRLNPHHWESAWGVSRRDGPVGSQEHSLSGAPTAT